MRSTVKTRNVQHVPSRGQRVLAMLAIVALFAGFLVQHSLAANSGKTVTLGESLNDAERKELLELFGATSDDRIETVTVADTQEAMKGIIDREIKSAYSSTALTCRDLGEGLEVNTSSITIITPSLYAMALVTAGIGDAELLVAAPKNAAAEGLTALTGVFKTWDIAPCDSGSTTKARQRLALEELALAVAIGQSFGTPTGVQDSGDLVLYTQQAVVVEGLTESAEISDAIAKQEALLGITVPAELRTKLVELMVKLAKEDIDWSTFSAGWTITASDDGNGISMKGDGIAIRNAQMTATVRAADNMTATAIAEKEASATAAAELSAAQTATAQADSANLKATAEAGDASARATQDALAAGLTATANAQPTTTPTPVPEPTATPEPVAVAGEIIDIRGGQVWVKPTGGGEIAGYTVPAEASITRGGKNSSLSAIKSGDKVNLTVDPYSQTVQNLSATAPAQSLLSKLSKLLFLLPALAVIPIILLIRGRGGAGDTFVVKRIASA